MINTSPRRAHLIFLLVAATWAVTACGSDTTAVTTTASPESTTTSSAGATTTTSTAAATTTSTAAATTTTVTDSNDLASGSGCTPGAGDLSDGEWFGFVTGRGNTTIDFDLACWFFGDAATVAAAEDGEESPPPNDYYIRNESDRIRTLALAEGVEVIYYPDGDPNNVRTIGYADWAGLVDQRGYELGVWLTVETGVVTLIEEQWVP